MGTLTCSLLALSPNVNLELSCRNVSLWREQSQHVCVPGWPVQSAGTKRSGVIYLRPKHDADIMVASSKFTVF